MVNGILNVNKPPGPTSHDVVDLVRKLAGIKRIGHGGTLDPAATGVLPILIGQATRVSEHLLNARKRYRAEVRLGIATDTFDSQGRAISETDPGNIKREQVEHALEEFHGTVRQTPPMYSAVKYQGRRLYKLARAGLAVERKAREVQVYGIRLTGWAPPLFAMEIECGRGAYIRAIANDLGAKLGCGAHLWSLVRSQVGPFCIEDAVTVEALHNTAHGGYLEELLHALDWALLDLPAAILTEDEERTARHGMPLYIEKGSWAAAHGETCRAYGWDGELVAVLTRSPEGEVWRPSKVFGGGAKAPGSGPIIPTG